MTLIEVVEQYAALADRTGTARLTFMLVPADGPGAGEDAHILIRTGGRAQCTISIAGATGGGTGIDAAEAAASALAALRANAQAIRADAAKREASLRDLGA